MEHGPRTHLPTNHLNAANNGGRSYTTRTTRRRFSYSYDSLAKSSRRLRQGS